MRGALRETLDSLQSEDPHFQYRIEEMDLAESSEIDPGEEIVTIGVEAIQKVTGKKPPLRGFSGFTDSRFYVNQLNIPTLILGPGGVDQSHTTDESVEVDALVQAAHIYAMILMDYLSRKGDP